MDSKVAVVHLLLDLATWTGQKHIEVFDGAGNTPVLVKLQ
jgi:hypothetical protein